MTRKTDYFYQSFLKLNYCWTILFLLFTLTACEPENTENSRQQVSVGETQHLQREKTPDYSNTPFKILDFAERDYQGSSSLGIVLSVPLDAAAEFQKYFVLERRDGAIVDGQWQLADNGREVFFKNIEPEEDYLLTVYANLTAVNGQLLGERFQQSLTTKAINASVSFAHDGGILPLSQSKGLPIYSVNIHQVDIDFHRVNDDQLMAFLESWRGGRRGVYQLEQYAEKSTLVYSARFDLAITKNKRERIILPLKQIAALDQAGIYLAVMKVPGHYDYEQAVTYFVRSDIGVHVRRYPGQLDIYTRSLLTGHALAGVKISLLDEHTQLLETGTADKNGQLSFIGNLKKAQLLLVQKGRQMSLVKLNRPALDLSEFNVGQRRAHNIEAFIYGPRDLYRPGETIDISMLLRNFDGKPVPDIPLKALLKGEDGQIVERFSWHASQPGYYSHRYSLPANARTGRWHIEVQLPGDKTPRKWFFSVEDFLPERMKLTFVEPDPDTFLAPGEQLQLRIKGEYLYGAPAAGNRLETNVQTVLAQQAVAQLPDYLFGPAAEDNAEQSYSLDEAQLDAQGELNLSIPARWQKIKSPVLIKVTGSLFESGGRAVKRQVKYRYWPAAALIGIRAQSDSPAADSLLKFDVVNADQSGQLHPADNLQVTLIKKRRDYYWTYNDSNDWEMAYSEKQYPVFSSKLSIAAGEKALLEVPVEWGEYRLEIVNPATRLTTSIEMYAGGRWYENNQRSRINRPDRINLALDKEAYKAGDSALLTIKSPFKGTGFVLLENNHGRIWQQAISINDSYQLQLKIPVDKAWQQHDIYISAIVFNQPDNVQQSSAATGQTVDIKRAIGLLHLPLDRSQRKLELNFTVAEKSRPFRKLPVSIKLHKNTASARSSALSKKIMVTLAAVDAGVLSVSNFHTPEPFHWFFGQRRYTVDSMDLYGNIMDGRKGIRGRQRFGGDMDMSSAGNLQKAAVKIVSLFHQPVQFNEQGEAIIELDIPDFNGRLRLMAVAFNDDSFGHAEQEITIAAPVVTQLSMPGFLAANDQSQLTLDIHNLTDLEQKFQLNMSSDAMLEITEPERELVLNPGEKTTLNFTLKSRAQFGLADITLSLTDLAPAQQEEAINLQRHWQLAVRPAWPALLRSEQRLLNNEQSLVVKINTDDLLLQTLQGKLLISDQLPINLAAHLSHLLKYPYGCLEQTASSSFPWLFADRNNLTLLGLNDLKIDGKAIDFSKRKQYLQRGIQKLSSKQLTNGGFGLWSNRSSEEMWLTVYAADFLLQSRAQGVDVPAAVLKPTVKRLQQYLRSSRPGYNYRYSQHPEHLTLAYKAYAAYVLARLKQAPLGTMRTLYDYHRKDARSGLPLMHLGIALSLQGDKTRGQKAIEQALLTTRQPHSYLGDYGSQLRDLSLMLEALLRFQPQHAGINGLLIKLQDELGKRQWLSTQERNALFMAGVALKTTGTALAADSSWQALITTALAEKNIVHKGDYQLNLEQADMLEGLRITSLSKARLYVNLDISSYTKSAPEPDFSHFTINRTYYNTRGEVILPQQINVGELMIVELSLQAKNRIQDALVVDLLPAGFEIENQNLQHSIKLDSYHIGSEALIDKMSSASIKYQAWRDDRYIAAVDIKGHGTQRLYYLLRAVTPGHYQVPPPYAEDMYRPYIRAIGETPQPQSIVNRPYKM